ncbi:hypothetical protein [Moorena sp. SIO4G3]|uniref:hypothetical protein n=1 Tax=Moorena sp. SIO4G3 TaxID=2607821 RepID=UPI00142929B7|nr:hypothetical protein [Moorena sp. SIO4G3]NEO77302.1 hypothetical protein [Moorena sp. SIO4G3]
MAILILVRYRKFSLLPTPDSRLPTPDSRLPTPDSRLPTPDFLLSKTQYKSTSPN